MKVLYLSFIPWIVQTLYLIGFFPQLLQNYQRRSTKGIAGSFLWILLFGYIFQVYYVFAVTFPVAYRVFVPLTTFFVGMLVAQLMYYGSAADRRQHSRLVLAALALFGVLTGLGSIVPAVGLYAGWISSVLWTVYELPQVYKNYQRRDASGLSLYLLSFWLIAGIGELFYSFAVNLPLPSKVTAIRITLMTTVLLYQYVYYGYREQVIALGQMFYASLLRTALRLNLW